MLLFGMMEEHKNLEIKTNKSVKQKYNIEKTLRGNYEIKTCAII